MTVSVPPPLAAYAGCPGTHLDRGSFYALAARHGYHYGPQFQGAVDVSVTARGIEGEIEAGPQVSARAARHAAHPAILDSCMQTAIPIIDLAEGRPILATGDDEAERHYPLYLPIGATAYAGSRRFRPRRKSSSRRAGRTMATTSSTT